MLLNAVLLRCAPRTRPDVVLRQYAEYRADYASLFNPIQFRVASARPYRFFTRAWHHLEIAGLTRVKWLCYTRVPWAISSVGERFPHTEEATGSIPVSPTIVLIHLSAYPDPSIGQNIGPEIDLLRTSEAT
jgi:hypothetical protein